MIWQLKYKNLRLIIKRKSLKKSFIKGKGEENFFEKRIKFEILREIDITK